MQEATYDYWALSYIPITYIDLQLFCKQMHVDSIAATASPYTG